MYQLIHGNSCAPKDFLNVFLQFLKIPFDFDFNCKSIKIFEIE